MAPERLLYEQHGGRLPSSAKMSSCSRATTSATFPEATVRGFWRLEIGGKGGVPAALAQDGGALGASVALLKRTTVGGNGCGAGARRGEREWEVFAGYGGCSTALVLAVGAPGLYMGEGAIVMAIVVAQPRTGAAAQPAGIPAFGDASMSSRVQFFVASHAVVRAPVAPYAALAGAPWAAMRVMEPPRVVDTEGPEGPAAAAIDRPTP